MISNIKVLESRFVKSCATIADAPQVQFAEIAILGRSNVGKSSLINALLNRKNLAKSSSTPGKTRLVNFFESRWRVESVDSANQTKNAESKTANDSAEVSLDCHDSATFDKVAESRNDNSTLNANSSIVSEKSGLRSHEQGNKTRSLLTKRVVRLPDLSPQDEFAIHILDFPGFGYAKVSKAEKDSWDKNLSAFLKKRESIKLFIHLIDSRHENLKIDSEIRAFLHAILRPDADILEVFTKADKLKKSEIRALKDKILVSTMDKNSVKSLRCAILQTMYHI